VTKDNPLGRPRHGKDLKAQKGIRIDSGLLNRALARIDRINAVLEKKNLHRPDDNQLRYENFSAFTAKALRSYMSNK